MVLMWTCPCFFPCGFQNPGWLSGFQCFLYLVDMELKSALVWSVPFFSFWTLCQTLPCPPTSWSIDFFSNLGFPGWAGGSEGMITFDVVPRAFFQLLTSSNRAKQRLKKNDMPKATKPGNVEEHPTFFVYRLSKRGNIFPLKKPLFFRFGSNYLHERHWWMLQ